MAAPLRHFSHGHFLQRNSRVYAGVSCNLCNRSIPRFKNRYTCLECPRWNLHMECARSQEHMDHPLHPLHRLLLAKRPLSDNICCYYCEKPISNAEYSYACEQLCSNFYMHISCAMIPLPTTASNVDGVLQFVCHEKSMTLREDDDDDDDDAAGAKCLACQSDRLGSAYVCTTWFCENFLHKSCVEYLRENICHPFHPHHSLRLQVSKRCRSCCRKDWMLVFCCHEHGCDFNLCIECTSLNKTVRCRSHHHLLALVEKSSCEIQCDACQKTYEKSVQVVPDEVNRTRSLLFRCMDCAFNLHFLCGPLPSTVKYECHMHNLILSDHSSFKNDREEYCCDVCEEEMDLAFRIYYCQECKYAAHIYCLIPEIMKTIKGDTKDVELKTLGDRWDQLAIGDFDDQPNECTLDEIIKNMPSESEKKLLLDPFHDSRSRRQWHAWYRGRFIYRHNLKGSIEDADGLREFFSMSPFRCLEFRSELYYFTPEESMLKSADKYLGQKVQNVGGYMVPVTLAPIFKTLLRKYGDLQGYQDLQPTMRSIGATLLCVVIDKMCRTKVEDITWEELKRNTFNMQAIKEITGFKIGPYLGDLFLQLEVFLGFEAIRYETKIREEHDNKIAELKMELGRWEDSREKLKTYASEMSDFMKKCWSKASKMKHKYWADMWFDL